MCRHRTEQSLLHEDKSVTSHVQIRGSIPVLWSSPTNLRYHPKVRIDPDQEASLRALRCENEKHAIVGFHFRPRTRLRLFVREIIRRVPLNVDFFFDGVLAWAFETFFGDGRVEVICP